MSKKVKIPLYLIIYIFVGAITHTLWVVGMVMGNDLFMWGMMMSLLAHLFYIVVSRGLRSEKQDLFR